MSQSKKKGGPKQSANDTNEPKRGRGAPSKYDPEICDKIVELGRQGKSKAQIRAAIGIHHKTWGEWAQKHPEFGAAIKEAYELSMAWWEDVGMNGVFQGMKFNATAYIFQVKNRFPAEYRDRQEHNVTSSTTVTQTLQVKADELRSAPDHRDALRLYDKWRSDAVSLAPIQPPKTN